MFCPRCGQWRVSIWQCIVRSVFRLGVFPWDALIMCTGQRLLIGYDQDRRIRALVRYAEDLEKVNRRQAVRTYRDAIERIKKFDARSLGQRSAKYPINRLSLVLERLKDYRIALDEIRQYEAYDDQRGLPKQEREAIRKREQRLVRRLQSGL